MVDMENSVPKLNAPISNREADYRLMTRVRQGETAARAELVDRVLDPVRRTASYLARGREDAQDLAQSALIRILQAAGEFRGDASIEHWAKRITVYTCAKAFEKRTRRHGLLEQTHPPLPKVEDLEAQTEAYRARRRLAELLGTLDYKVRTAMVLHYLDDHSITETADLTDAPINTVRGRLRKGRKALRKKILNDPLLCNWIKEIAP